MQRSEETTVDRLRDGDEDRSPPGSGMSLYTGKRRILQSSASAQLSSILSQLIFFNHRPTHNESPIIPSRPNDDDQTQTQPAGLAEPCVENSLIGCSSLISWQRSTYAGANVGSYQSRARDACFRELWTQPRP